MDRSGRSDKRKINLEALSDEELIEFIDSVEVKDLDYVVDNVEGNDSAEQIIAECINKMNEVENTAALNSSMNVSSIEELVAGSTLIFDESIGSQTPYTSSTPIAKRWLRSSKRPISPNTPDPGASSNIGIRLSKPISDFVHHILYFDNFYTSLPLLVYLQARGIYSLGTVRANRIPDCKLPTYADVSKKA
ncbi:uncharacterized protein [Eurosta solidaginis]|uniref:uncharacterized protein n=1 Tax=Eurosta solidaginis TaxID=178769 RepID=UPI0035313EDE